MSEESSADKGISKHRVTLNAESKERIDGWRNQLLEKYSGIRISDSDFVNWFIAKHPPTLTSKQLLEAKESFFDEIRELEWMLAQAKAAKEKAESSSNPA